MNRQEFSEILINPHSLKTDQIKKINLILNTFPYFQSARAIYLKGLKSNNSFKYNQALKTTAAYTTNRNVLFDFITSDSFNQNDISQPELWRLHTPSKDEGTEYIYIYICMYV